MAYEGHHSSGNQIDLLDGVLQVVAENGGVIFSLLLFNIFIIYNGDNVQISFFGNIGANGKTMTVEHWRQWCHVSNKILCQCFKFHLEKNPCSLVGAIESYLQFISRFNWC